MKLYLRPNGSEIDPGTGIGQVCLAQLKYLPDFDIRVIDDYKDADVIACHTQGFDLPRIDVLHCHGLYWSGDPGGSYLGWHSDANKRIVDAARRAKVITVPSEWVAGPFRRDMRIDPMIVGHGIEFSEWQATDNGGFVLWNKNRPNDVCNPQPAYDLAAAGIPVRATFAPDGKPALPSLTVTGRLPFAAMKELIQAADVYLATTKETFGIGTIEAMACGVPVLGWDWGGTADIVTHKVDGWLCYPGDLDGLVEGYRWIQAHRVQLGEAAREKAKKYDWPSMIALYAEAYRQAEKPDPVGVAVVIPNHNYGKYVNEAIYSCLKQARKPEQIIVVDDGSTDNSREVIQSFSQAGVEIIFQDNAGVAAARNNGIAHANQPFIICLDADDRLAPDFIKALLPAMKADRGLGIAYAGIGMIHGERPAQRYTAWPPEFTWEQQSTPHVPPSNCIPSACMFRRTMWERAGGFRQQYAPGEDTEFWTRGLSVGFTAKKVTDASLFEYRVHQGSASRKLTYSPIDTWLPWMNDQEYPFAAPANKPPIVRSYSDPMISVIIPCAPNHVGLLPSAIESVLGQDFRDWEIVVAYDDWDDKALVQALEPYPFVKWTLTYGRLGAGFARNAGLHMAKAPLVLWLDADDYIQPGTLTAMLDAWQNGGGRFIYTDWQTDGGEIHKSPDYDHMLYGKALYHGVTALMTKEQAEIVGGFDPELPAWEDWDFYLKMACAGHHGKRLEGAYLVYRPATGERRRIAKDKTEELRHTILSRYQKYLLGDEAMAPCCGGGRAASTIINAKRAIGQLPPEQDTANLPDLVRMEYYGPRAGGVTYTGPSGRRYVFGNSTTSRYNDVDKKDVSLFLGMEGFRVIQRSKPQPPEEKTPAPLAVTPTPAKVEVVEATPVQDTAPVKRTRKAKAAA